MNRNSKKPSRVVSFIYQQEPLIEKVEWLSNKPSFNQMHLSLRLTGRPDGFLHYRDGRKAVIELKTVPELPKEARDADLHQADIYALLYSDHVEIHEESFVLYTVQSKRDLALFKRKRILTNEDLAEILDRVERGAKLREILKPTRSKAKCNGCGYRSICAA